MDFATIIGFALIIASLSLGVFSGGDPSIFFNTPSVFIVFFGVLGATFIKWPMEIIRSFWVYSSKGIFVNVVDLRETMDGIGALAEVARRESVFALEKIPVDDPFLRKAMALAADNRPPEMIQAIMKLEMDALEERHKIGQDVLAGIGQDGPAFGMIGTLVGLVLMLQNISDPTSVGPSMAVALLTTLYGAIIANAFALPLSNKLSIFSKKEQMRMKMIIVGASGIVVGENPRLIKERLNAYLPTNDRDDEEDIEE